MKLLAILFLLLTSVPACQLVQPATGITVHGTVLDKYTRQPVAGVPIIARRLIYGNYGNTVVDSLASTYTDSQGHYTLSFDASGQGYYRVRPDVYGTRFTDLTSYPGSPRAADGIEVTAGTNQSVDFQVARLVPTKVTLNLDKRGASLLQLSAGSAEDATQGTFPTVVFTDTVLARQRLVTTRLVYLAPNTTYRFQALRALIHCRTGQSQCSTTNLSTEYFSRTISYPDTAAISLP